MLLSYFFLPEEKVWMERPWVGRVFNFNTSWRRELFPHLLIIHSHRLLLLCVEWNELWLFCTRVSSCVRETGESLMSLRAVISLSFLSAESFWWGKASSSKRESFLAVENPVKKSFVSFFVNHTRKNHQTHNRKRVEQRAARDDIFFGNWEQQQRQSVWKNTSRKGKTTTKNFNSEQRLRVRQHKRTGSKYFFHSYSSSSFFLSLDCCFLILFLFLLLPFPQLHSSTATPMSAWVGVLLSSALCVFLLVFSVSSRAKQQRTRGEKLNSELFG